MTLDPRPPWPGHSRLLSGQLSSSELKVIISSSIPFPSSTLSVSLLCFSFFLSLSLVSTLHSPLAGSWQPAVRIVFGISFGVISLLLLVSAAPCQHAPIYHNGQAAACPACLHPYRPLLSLFGQALAWFVLSHGVDDFRMHSPFYAQLSEISLRFFCSGCWIVVCFLFESLFQYLTSRPPTQ